jgi:hypothetical protein
LNNDPALDPATANGEAGAPHFDLLNAICVNQIPLDRVET